MITWHPDTPQPERPGLPLPVYVEGIDGAGKSTLIKRLYPWAWPVESRIACSWFNGPRSWPSRDFARCLKLAGLIHPGPDSRAVAHLLDFCGAFHLLSPIDERADTEAPGWVTVQFHDRGPLSTCAYQRPHAVIRDQLLALIPPGSVTVILDVPVELAAERRRARAAAWDRLDEDRGTDLAPVREAYLRLAGELPGVHVLDGTRPTDDLAAAVRGLIFAAAPAWRRGLRSQRLR
jgi:thymidylate kinase